MIPSKESDNDKHKYSKMHRCPVCLKFFSSPSKLQRHYFIHTGLKPFHCSVCGKAFNQPVHLKRHSQKCHQVPDSLKDSNLFNALQFPPSNHSELLYRHNGGEIILPPAKYIVLSQIKQKSNILPTKVGISTSENQGKSESIPQNCHSLINHNHSAIDSPSHRKAQDKVHFSMDNNLYYIQHENEKTCRVCLRSFSSSLQLQIHSAVHKKGKKLDYRGCRKMQSHEFIPQRREITKSHQCPACLKRFCAPSKLERHFLIHTGQKPFSCMQCGKAFRQETHMKSHLHAAHTTALLQKDLEENQVSGRATETSSKLCHGIPLSMSEEPQLVLQPPHIQEATVNSSVELELQCKISVSALQDRDKSIVDSGASVKPEHIVNDNGQHSNNICSGTHNQSVEHEHVQLDMIYKDPKPFQCLFCSRSFHQELNLIRHWDTYHKEQEGMQSHRPVDNIKNVALQSVNPDTFNPKEITSPEPHVTDDTDLNVVVKSETWAEDNKESFLRASPEQPNITLQGTRQRKGSVSHQCHVCSKIFPVPSKLQRHMMSHTGQRPFKCRVCEKSFRQKTHLRVHSRTHLWSRYHRKRSFYISRPPSRVAGHNAKPSSDGLVAKRFLHFENFEKTSDTDAALKMQHDQAVPLPYVESGNRGFMPGAANRISTIDSNVSEVILKKGQTDGQSAQSAHARHCVQHKCLLCLKCFSSPSKLRRHEMVHTGLKPFQCVVCGKCFRQAPHLKVHERTHSEWGLVLPVHQHASLERTRRLKATESSQRPTSNTNYYIQEEAIRNGHVLFEHKDKAPMSKNVVPAQFMESHKETKEPQPHYTSADYVCNGPSHSNKRIDTNWLTMSEVDLLGDDKGLEAAQKENGNDFVDMFSFEIQNEGTEASGGQRQDMGTNKETQFQTDSRVDDLETHAREAESVPHEKPPQAQLHNGYWCEPLSVLECGRCGGTFVTQQDLRCHACNGGGQSKIGRSPRKYHCDICFKCFAAPSKLERHYVIHTGQRPFRCDLCGKTFTQSSHLRTHRKAHQL